MFMKSLVSLVAVAMLLVAGAGDAHAQDTRAAARDLAKKWQDAVVNVRVVLKTRMSMGGREMQSADDSVDAVGTVIDPGGLTVMSLGALNPGAMMGKIVSASSGDSETRVDISSEPTELKMRLPDGRELPAKIVLRDEDLDLAFIRPTVPVDPKLVAVNLADSARPALLDQVLVLSRLGRVGGWTGSAALADIGAIIERPRTFYVLAGTPPGMGTPAFTAAGKLVGLLTLRQIDPGRTSVFSMGTGDALGLLPVILPAEDVLEISKQATEK
jgi:S1-C subfamily serine protease